MQEPTLSVNSDDGQKQAASLLESHFGMESQVLMHLGTTSGQGAVTMGGTDVVEDATTDGCQTVVGTE